MSLLALGVRTLPVVDFVLPERGEVRLFGVDAYYHLRHARFSVEHFPRVMRWDVGTHYPTGERSNAAGLFDVAIAGAALLFGLGDPDELTLRRTAAWTPAVLGALVVPALYWLARGTLPRGAALAACAFFLAYPGRSLERTILGFADHHVAEILLLLLSIGGLVHCLRAEHREERPGWTRPALLHALPLAILLFTWGGAALYLVLAGAGLILAASFEIARGDAERMTRLGVAGFRYGAGLLLFIGPAELLFPDLVLVPRYQSVVVLLGVGLALGPPAYLQAGRRLVRAGLPPRAVGLAGLALATAAPALVLVADAELRVAFEKLVGAKTLAIREHAVPTWSRLWRALGPVGVLAIPGAAVGLAGALWRDSARSAAIPVATAAGLVAFWSTSGDYAYAFPPFAALCAAIGLAEGARGLPARLAPLRRAAAAAIGLAVAIPLFWPATRVQRPWPTRQATESIRTVNEGWVQAMRWLRERTPEPTLSVTANVDPFAGDFTYPPGSYGVLSLWVYGNFVNALGHRVPVWSRGSGLRDARYLLAESEDEAMPLLCERCGETEAVRYVITDARTIADYFRALALSAGRPLERYTAVGGVRPVGAGYVTLETLGPAYERSMAARLHLQDGTGMEHLRLLYESPHESYVTYLATPAGPGRDAGYVMQRVAIPIESDAERETYRSWVEAGDWTETPLGFVYGGTLAPTVKIFEIVPGARVEGSAQPGDRVEVSLRLRASPTGRRIRYRQVGYADARGRFSLVVPHATEGRPPGAALEPLGRYVLRIGSEDGEARAPGREVAVSERDVRNARRILVTRPGASARPAFNGPDRGP